LLISIAVISCNKIENNKLIYLNAEQLQKLGIEVTESGVMYKNLNPNWVADNERYPILGFIATDDTYLTTMHFNESESISISSKSDSLFASMELTQNDFYPILIGSINDDFSLDRKKLNSKLLPIAICMADITLQNRTDTLVIWFNVTESIAKILPSDINLNEYARIPK
jgi:hypothetical protein